MKTIAQQLNIKKFPFRINDDSGNLIYSEDADGFWVKMEYDYYGNEIAFEFSDGKTVDNKAKPCQNKIVEIDGVKYKLVKQ